jgi:hypothetical protein
VFFDGYTFNEFCRYEETKNGVCIKVSLDKDIGREKVEKIIFDLYAQWKYAKATDGWYVPSLENCSEVSK